MIQISTHSFHPNPRFKVKIPDIIKGRKEGSALLVTQCTQDKGETPDKARKLYRDKAGRVNAFNHLMRILNLPGYFLSALHGLVNAETIISPYDKQLQEKDTSDFISKTLIPQLAELQTLFSNETNVELLFLTGNMPTPTLELYIKSLNSAIVEVNKGISGPPLSLTAVDIESLFQPCNRFNLSCSRQDGLKKKQSSQL